MQNHYNLIYREEEREMLPLCKEYDIAVTPYSPLARGFLSGERKTDRSKNDEIAKKYYQSKNDYKILEATNRVAADLGITPVQVAVSWLLQKKEIKSIILGPRNIQQLDDIVKKKPILLEKSKVDIIEKFYKPKSLAGHK